MIKNVVSLKNHESSVMKGIAFGILGIIIVAITIVTLAALSVPTP